MVNPMILLSYKCHLIKFGKQRGIESNGSSSLYMCKNSFLRTALKGDYILIVRIGSLSMN
jgi:hypothetical protein